MEEGRQVITIIDRNGNRWQVPAVLREHPDAEEMVKRDIETVGMAVLISISEGLRSKYQTGRKARLVEMEPGDRIEVPFQTKTNYGSWRSIISKLKEDYGCVYHIHKEGETLQIWREK